MVFSPQLVGTMSENESLPALQSLVPCVIIYLFIYLFQPWPNHQKVRRFDGLKKRAVRVLYVHEYWFLWCLTQISNDIQSLISHNTVKNESLPDSQSLVPCVIQPWPHHQKVRCFYGFAKASEGTVCAWILVAIVSRVSH